MIALGAFISLLFIPGIPSPAVTPRWAALSLLIPLLWLFKDMRPGGTQVVLWLALLGYGVLLPMPDPYTGTNALWLLMLGAGFAWLMQEGDFRRFMIGLGCGAIVNAAVTVAQVYGWAGLPQTYVPGGLFMNKNPNGEFAALLLVGFVGWRLWWLVPAPLITLVLSGSKASMLGVAAAAVFLSRAWLLAGAAIIVLAGTAYPMFEGHFSHLVERTVVWRDLMGNLTLYGNGLGSYMARAPVFEGTTYIYAHNDWLQLVFELGIGVLPLVALIILAFRFEGCRVEKAVLVTFAVEACFGFPSHFPVTLLVACGGLGAVLESRARLRAHERASQHLLRHGYAGSRRHFGSPAFGAGRRGVSV